MINLLEAKAEKVFVRFENPNESFSFSWWQAYTHAHEHCQLILIDRAGECPSRYATEPNMITCAVDLSFPARTHHVPGAISLRTQNDPPRCTRLFSVRLRRIKQAMRGREDSVRLCVQSLRNNLRGTSRNPLPYIARHIK